MSYKDKITQLSNRYNPEKAQVVESRQFSNSDLRSTDSDVVNYTKRAMCAVDMDYTQKTKEAGAAAEEHLGKALRDVSFAYQGSVMTDTHIKGASDIDLLVFCEKFHKTDIQKVRKELQRLDLYTREELSRLRNYNQSFSPYQGNGTMDLANLRTEIENIMIRTYDICETSHAKAVKIKNKHLDRDVDIVTACWFESFDSVLRGIDNERLGINIYNKEKNNTEGPDYPFLSISRINSRSKETCGRLKRMIRFLKNVRTDSNQNMPLTSFDINAICYSIPIEDYANCDYKQLVHILWYTMYHLWQEKKENQLKSVIGDEYIFRGKPEKVEALKKLEDEVYKIKTDLEKA